MSEREEEKTQIFRTIERVHEEKRPFKCNTCSASYSAISGLKRHIMSAHEGNKPFGCESCPKYFLQKALLNKHILEVHEKNKCILCEDQFDNNGEFEKHVSICKNYSKTRVTTKNYISEFKQVNEKDSKPSSQEIVTSIIMKVLGNPDDLKVVAAFRLVIWGNLSNHSVLLNVTNYQKKYVGLNQQKIDLELFSNILHWRE